jgi:hypothetical protein
LLDEGSEQVNRLNLLIFVAGSDFLRFLQRFLGLHRHFFESHHDNTSQQSVTEEV